VCIAQRKQNGHLLARWSVIQGQPARTLLIEVFTMNPMQPFLPASAPASLSAIIGCVLLAVVAFVALCLVHGVAGDDGEPRGIGKRFFLRAALITGALQIALAPVAVVLLAPAGLATRTYTALYIAIAALLFGVIAIWRELADPTRGSGIRFPLIVVFFLTASIGLVSTRLIHQDEVSYAYQMQQQKAQKTAANKQP
jgi:hypothetical protein